MGKVRKKSRSNAIYVVILITMISIVGFLFLKAPSNKFEQYLKGSTSYLYYEGEVISDYSPLFANDISYVSLSFIKDKAYPYIYFSLANSNVTLFIDDEIIVLSGKDIAIKDEECYISTSIAEDVFGFYTHSFDKGMLMFGPNKKHDWVSVIAESAKLRKNRSQKSPYHSYLNKGDLLYVLNEDEDYLKLLDMKGNVGYLKSSEVKEEIIEEKTFKYKPFDKLDMTDKEVFAWEMIYEQIDDASNREIKKGIDIISPTQAILNDKDGNIDEWVSQDYIDRLDSENVDLHLCITNQFNQTEMTSEFLENRVAVDHFITSALEIVEKYELKGLHIDFENIPYKNKDDFTCFIAKLATKLHENDTILTMSVGVPNGSFNYSLVYDFKSLMYFADYLMVMTYEAEVPSGKKAAPVASISWTEEKLLDLQGLISLDRVYLGIPLYTRIWDMNGEDAMGSIAVSIARQEEIIKENENTKVEYDNLMKQFFFRYEKEGHDYLMYIEDNNIRNERVKLFKKYKMAGVALWEKTFLDANGIFELAKKVKD